MERKIILLVFLSLKKLLKLSFKTLAIVRKLKGIKIVKSQDNEPVRKSFGTLHNKINLYVSQSLTIVAFKKLIKLLTQI